mmetsp:Transcript_11879/g.26004  ORF Transcript_11879/g.26004 Transcript_11879/m.26004 type:complete len:250 (+) Transcript_11879:191-940(+)
MEVGFFVGASVMSPESFRSGLVGSVAVMPVGSVTVMLVSSGGRSTLLMTWIIPLDAIMSAITTSASLTFTPAPDKSIATVSPSRVSRSVLVSEELRALAATTWYLSMAISLSLFSGRSKVSKVPAGRAAKASLVGANTVKGPLPSPESTSTKSAAVTASTRVLNTSSPAAISTMLELTEAGVNTLSIPCTTPLSANTSASMTMASSLTRVGSRLMVMFAPLRVVTVIPSLRSAARTLLPIAWYLITSAS